MIADKVHVRNESIPPHHPTTSSNTLQTTTSPTTSPYTSLCTPHWRSSSETAAAGRPLRRSAMESGSFVVPHGGTMSRTTYQASTVNAPAICASESQSRTCNNDGLYSFWYGTYSEVSCTVQADSVDECAATSSSLSTLSPFDCALNAGISEFQTNLVPCSHIAHA